VESPIIGGSPGGGDARSLPALCVDLDGTLVKSNTLLDSLLVLARKRPMDILRLPGWLAKGRVVFKQRVSAAVQLDVEHLPYNQLLLEYLRKQHGAGRPLYLATAADSVLADHVAGYLGIFDEVLASDGVTNLAGENKLAAFRGRFPEGFCYIGNARPDASLLAASETPMVANPHLSLRHSMRRSGTVPAVSFIDRAPLYKSWLRAVRLHQWAKNTLIFVPLLLAHQWNAGTLTGAAVAFFSFGMCASATYIINDLLDLETDRRHPRKRRRPFAAGDLSAISGVIAVLVLMAAAAALAVALPAIVGAVAGYDALEKPYSFLGWLGLYTVTTLIYSLYLKRRLLLDVFVLSGLYTIRILAGWGATGVEVSAWLAGFSVFFFLSLAYVKRFSELKSLGERGDASTSGRGYGIGDLEMLRALGVGSAYAAVVVMTLYINNGSNASSLYHHPVRLWMVVPVLLLWLSHVWMLASRGQMHDDPVIYAVTDRRSLFLGVLMAAVVWFAL
jgi:4-hydroxybenzoate polyprenyltransferase